MRLQNTLILADLHLDLGQQARCGLARCDAFESIPVQDWSSIEGLIIAGDLSNKPHVRWKYAIRYLTQYIDPDRIHVIPGNHDYFDFQIDREDRLAEILTAEGAHLAQKKEILIAGARFLCCTLWTDFALHGDISGAQQIARTQMNDYRYIRKAYAGFRRIRPYETAQIHADHRSWLETRLATDHTGSTIVVTHHCPHPKLVGPMHGDLAPAYGSDLTALIKQYQPEAWLFGHTHHAGELTVGRTRIANVSVGTATPR